jgi:hypothetical protein
MSANDRPRPSFSPVEPARASGFFLYLPIIILLISNLIPLLGVLYWGWDTFVLLMLYWLETLVIAFWTLIRILIAGDFARNFVGEVIGRVFMFCFFLVHAGGFMAGHFLFLWAFYAGDWGSKIQVSQDFFALAPREFWNKMVLANGLLIPLAISFIGRGIAFVVEMAKLPLWTHLVSEGPTQTKNGALVGGLYVRIVIMHLVILGGAALAQKYGALAPLILLIIAKTVVDIALFIRIDLKGQRAVSV